MNKGILVVIIGSILSNDSIAALANKAAILSVNNQAFIDGQLGHDQLTYNMSHPADAGGPLYNAQGFTKGVQLGLTKTFDHVYTQLALGINQFRLNYFDSSLEGVPLSNGNSVTLSMTGRLGYSFYLEDNFFVTPYLMGGYFHNQIDTGGYSTSFIAGNYNGATYFTQAYRYGVGVLNQWSVMPRWILSADLQLETQAHPWVNGNVNNFNNQAGATITYQQWNLTSAPAWQIGLGSDYRFTPNLHFRAGLAYGQRQLGGKDIAFNDGIYPSQNDKYWLGTLGLGYSFLDGVMGDKDQIIGGQELIHAVNNQGSFQLGYQSPGFNGGTTLASYQQSGGIPYLGILLNKTWKAVYTQLAMVEGIGKTTYDGQIDGVNISSPLHNTTFEGSGKLGYQFISSQHTVLTPYATMGYHRASQSFQGTPSTPGALNGITQTYFLNGLTETYQNGWYGIGLLMQWAALPQLVLNANGDIGQTFAATMRSWTPLGLTIDTPYTLGNATYQAVSLGADYLWYKNWHAKINLDYTHYRYNASGINAFGISTLNDRVNQFRVGLGLGYTFG